MKKLLWAGVLGPLLFIVVFLIEGFTRRGYSQRRGFVSQLATGDGAWMQVLNLFVCGALVLAFAFGLRSALQGTRGSIGAPVLLGLLASADRRHLVRLRRSPPAPARPPARGASRAPGRAQ